MMHYNPIVAAVIFIVAFTLNPSLAVISLGEESITIFWSDLGINQWSPEMELGNNFSSLSKSQKETIIIPEGKGQILVPMPSDKELPTTEEGWQKLSTRIYEVLSSRAEIGLSSGVSKFEIRTVQNINSAGYIDPLRQGKVVKFTKAFCLALERLEKKLSVKNGLKVNGLWGSNGGYAASKVLPQIHNKIVDKGSLIDARAWKSDVKRLYHALGGVLAIINTAGDLPARNATHSIPVLHIDERMVAYHHTAKDLKNELPGLEVYWVDPKGANLWVSFSGDLQHLKSMHWDHPLLAKEFTGERYVKLGKMTGEELRARIFENYTISRKSSTVVREYPLADGLAWPRDAAALCLETASTLEEALNYLDETFEDNTIGNIAALHDFSSALQKDIEMAGESRFVLLRSHTMEQIGKFGLGKMPDLVDFLIEHKKLPSTFRLPTTFGAEEFTVAISTHIGSGKADIDTITNYLDGLNKGCWAIVGYLVGGPETAKLYQSIAGTGTKLLREVTLPLFNKGVLAWRQQGRQLVDQWHTLQERRIYDGLSVQPISEVYGDELLKKNGLGEKEIMELDVIAYDLNQSLIHMRGDFGIKKMETFKQTGKIEVGGINIDPELVNVGECGKGIREDVLGSRPSADSLSWPVEVSK